MIQVFDGDGRKAGRERKVRLHYNVTCNGETIMCGTSLADVRRAIEGHMGRLAPAQMSKEDFEKRLDLAWEIAKHASRHNPNGFPYLVVSDWPSRILVRGMILTEDEDDG